MTTDETLASLVEADSGYSFTVDVMRKLGGPCVYLLMLKGEPMYCGHSKHGVARPINPRHHALKGREWDEVRLWPTADLKKAKALEEFLILRLRPAWNVRRPNEQIAAAIGIPQSALRYSTRLINPTT